MKQVFRILAFFVALSIAGTIVLPVLIAYAQDATSIQDDISSLSKKLKKAQAQQEALAGELSQINSSLSAAQKAIVATKARIAAATNDIDRKQAEIDLIQDRIDGNRLILAGLVREMQAQSEDPLFSAVLSSDDVTRALDDPDRFRSIGERMNAIMADIHSSQQQTVQEEQNLEKLKQEHETALGDKLEEKQALAADQQETQADLKEQEATVSELKQKLAKLQSDLNAVTGESFDAKDIKEAIEFANKKTGVPKGILFAFLTQESGRGRNVGQCTYDDMEKKAVAAYKKYGKANNWNYKPSIDRLAYRKGLFEDLVDKLGYNENKKVSCAIIPADFRKYEPNQGGAMGVAQFMSDTWMNAGLQSQLKSYTGHSVPDPWSLTDGTMALAVKVKAAGGTSTNSSSIKKMVTNYYGASPDKSSVAKNYYNNILYYVKNYDKLIND